MNSPAVLLTNKRKINVGQLLNMRHCHRLFLTKKTERRRDYLSDKSVVGSMTAKLLAGGDITEARAYIDRRLFRRPEEERQQLVDDAVKFAANAKLGRRPEATADKLENTIELNCFGWTVCAQPDEKFCYWRPVSGAFQAPKNKPRRHRGGRRHRHRNQQQQQHVRVLRIEDVKTSPRIREWHWEQLYLFAAVIREALQWRGPIEIALRRARKYPFNVPLPAEVREYTDEDHEQWFAELRATLAEIERSEEQNDYPPTPGGYCFGCPLRNGGRCAEGVAYMEKVQAERNAARGLVLLSPGEANGGHNESVSKS